ncbi:MAG: response regulator transcription factor [Spirochaetes bacterium]|nr:response regulator transcription factor [Spirochaetota bacterium]
MKQEKQISIFIVDDHAIFREGLAMIIQKDGRFIVCGEAEDAENALTLIKKTRPDLVIADITLKDRSGIELVKDLKKSGLDIPVLVLSMHDESFYAERAIKAGARGYIMKHETSANITAAIQRILSGRIYLSDKMTDRMLDSLTLGAAPCLPSTDILTDREIEVLDMIGRGLTSGQIAANTNLSKKTIGAYREKLKHKLGLNNAAELSTYAYKWVEKKGQ